MIGGVFLGDKWLKRPDLVLEERFDFVAPYSLEECLRRLEAAKNKRAHPIRGQVEMEPASETSHRFQVRMHTKMGSAWLVGVLLQQDNETTSVSGVFGMGRAFIGWIVVFIPLVCVAGCMAIYQAAYLTLLLLAVAVPIVVWSNRSSARSHLFKFLDTVRV
jgi:hypothetical protein